MSIAGVTDKSNEQETQQTINAQAAELAKLEGELRSSEAQSEKLENQKVQVSGREAKAMGEVVDTSSESGAKSSNAETTLGGGIVEKAAAEATGFGGIIEGVSMVASAIGDTTHHPKGMGLDKASFDNARCIQTGFNNDIMGSAKIAGGFMNPKDISTTVKGAKANSSSIDAMQNCNKLKAGQYAQLRQEIGHSYSHKATLGHEAHQAKLASGAPVPGVGGSSSASSGADLRRSQTRISTLEQDLKDGPRPPREDMLTEGA